MTGPVPALEERAAAAARRLDEAESVLLASHIDADGLTSAGIASAALARAGILHDVVFEDQLDAEAIQRLADGAADVLFLTDFGSGQLDAVYEHAVDVPTVIADHHQPASAEDVPADAPSVEREYGSDYADAPCHVNPLLVGIDGASELSGAGATYCVARALAERTDGAAVNETAADGGTSDETATDGGTSEDTAADGGRAVGSDAQAAATSSEHAPAADNRDLAALAIVGAVGDMQTEDGELVGANADIAAEGVAAGVLETGTDLALYGTQTRPLPKLLAYAGELRVPGITNDRNGTARFLDDLDVDLRDEDGWRRWAELSMAERRTVASALLQHAVQRGVPSTRIDRLVGTTYTLSREEPGTELRDASEFSTLLNATARYDRADVGLAVCLGDRGPALESARDLLAEHRRNLSRGVDWMAEQGATREEHCQWVDAGNEIRPTILGIVAGMALGNGGVERSTPIVAFADDGEDRKVSARATPALVARGVDLSEAMHEAATDVGGGGGGHTVAAGATIPSGSEREFVERVDAVLGEQLAGD